MVLKKNVEAYFRIGIALNDLMYEIFDNIQGTHETIYGKFNIELHSIKVTSLSNLSIRLNNSIILKFKTPTLLSSKYMLPPIYKNKKIKEMSRLIPQPSLIISFLVRLWNSIAQPKELIVKGDSEWTPYMIGRIADVVFTEVGYNVRPVTAIIGKDNKDRLRKVRGFEGWVKYEVLRMKKYHEIFEKLLGLSEFLGVGRSRGIGFGVAELEKSE
jgi:CRISPR-associated endoribonuclease Cas6